MAECHKQSKQTADRSRTIERKRGNADSDKGSPSKTMPSYDPGEEWVREYVKKHGEEPGFF